MWLSFDKGTDHSFGFLRCHQRAVVGSASEEEHIFLFHTVVTQKFSEVIRTGIADEDRLLLRIVVRVDPILPSPCPAYTAFVKHEKV